MSADRLEMLLQMLEKDTEDSFLRYAVAKEYESRADYATALTFYIALKTKDPDYVGLYYHLAKLYETIEEPETALQIYDEGIAVAKRIQDLHALSELNSAKLNLEMEL